MLPRGVGRCKCLPRRSFHLGSWGGKCTPGRGVTVQMFISEAGSLANNKCPHVAMDGKGVLLVCAKELLSLLASPGGNV